MGKKIQVPAIGGIRKVIFPGGNTAAGTTIAEIGSNTVTLAQLAALLGAIEAPETGTIGGASTAQIVPSNGIGGGGPVIGAVPIYLTQPIPTFGIESGSGADDSGDSLMIPGPQGQRGLQGSQGPPGFPEDPDDPVMIPGPQGVAGAAGATGVPGASIPGLEGDAGEDAMMIPGNTGPTGATGATGAQGLQGPLGWSGDDGEDALMIPGPAGASGGGGGTPANPTNSVQFNNAGSFGGSANLLWSGTQLQVATASTSVAAQLITTGSTGIAVTFSDGTNTASFVGFDASHNLQVLAPSTYGITFWTGGGGAARATIASTGAVSIAAPASGNVALTVTGVANSVTALLLGASTSSQSFGLAIQAGSSSSDYAVLIANQANTLNFFQIKGNGSGNLGPSATLGISWDSVGEVIIAQGTASTNKVLQLKPNGSGAVGLDILDPGANATELRLNTTNSAINIQSAGGSATMNFLNGATTAFSITTGSALQGHGPVNGGLVDMTPDGSTFTMTYNTFSAGVTGTAVWSRNGNQVTLFFPGATGTSSGAGFTATGLPAAIQPARAQHVACPCEAFENSTTTVTTPVGAAISGGTVTFWLAGNTAWTATGTKGIINGGFSLTYLLN